MTSASSNTNNHFMDENKNVERPAPNVQRSIENQPFEHSALSAFYIRVASPQPPRIFDRTLARFPAGEKPVPKSSDGRLFVVTPSKLAVLAIKLLRNNFERTK